jgi:hypothetical protein
VASPTATTPSQVPVSSWPSATGAAAVTEAPVLQESLIAEKKKKPFFTIRRVAAMSIGTLLGIPLMLVGFITIQGALFTRASDSAPRDLVVAETTETSATIHWTTDQSTQAVIMYGTDPLALKLLAPETEEGQDHTVVIERLASGTTYHFIVKIGEDVFDNGGAPWTFLTKGAPAADAPAAPTATGSASIPVTTTPSGTLSRCPQTDECDIIREQLGKTCTTTDFIQCLKRSESTPTP